LHQEMNEREGPSGTEANEDAEGYQGWRNYPTWNMHLWLTSDEGTYHQAMTMLALGGSLQQGAENLCHFVEDNNPINELPGPYADILGWALQMVDWNEVAAALGPDQWSAPTEQPSTPPLPGL
jgi:hypothetical protein